jgi:flagellar secretion chaperone FliS
LAYARISREYQKNAVNGASPLQLVIMLYDGALKYLDAGRAAMAQGERDKQNSNLQKAQKIVMELMACLDMKGGGEIAKNLLSLYSYVLNELVMANLNDDPDAIDRSKVVLTNLRESWRQIQESLRPAAAVEAEASQLAA